MTFVARADARDRPESVHAVPRPKMLRKDRYELIATAGQPRHQSYTESVSTFRLMLLSVHRHTGRAHHVLVLQGRIPFDGVPIVERQPYSQSVQ